MPCADADDRVAIMPRDQQIEFALAGKAVVFERRCSDIAAGVAAERVTTKHVSRLNIGATVP